MKNRKNESKARPVSGKKQTTQHSYKVKDSSKSRSGFKAKTRPEEKKHEERRHDERRYEEKGYQGKGRFTITAQEEVNEVKSPSFAEKMTEALKKSYPELITTGIEPLANLSYEKELELKTQVFKEFWKDNNLPTKPEKVVASPKPRQYRTTTKRRIIRHKNRFYLLFSEDTKVKEREFFTTSLLEPEEHSEIYRYISERINEPVYLILGQCLNFIVVRGSYTEFSVIFNVHTLSGPIVRKLKALAEEIKRTQGNVISAFIYLDPTRSDYYLENLRPKDQISFKKLFGPDKLFVKFHDLKYSFYPTSFSQVNGSMVPVMLDRAKSMLLPADKPADKPRLIDLYCGYGLFSHYLADNFNETIGIEAEGSSIKSAIENNSFMAHKGKVKFLTKRITEESLDSSLPESLDIEEVYILDPPRQGTEKGVIKKIAQRRPLRVLHIFCNVDKIAEEIKQWKKNNYKIQKVIPLDMFPGTPNLEVMILLMPF